MALSAEGGRGAAAPRAAETERLSASDLASSLSEEIVMTSRGGCWGWAWRLASDSESDTKKMWRGAGADMAQAADERDFAERGRRVSIAPKEFGEAEFGEV